MMIQMLLAAGSEVKNPIPVTAIADLDVGGTPVASVTFGTNGSLSGIGTGTVVGDQWYSELTTGIGNSCWIRMTKNSGADPTSGALNTWLALSSARTWSWSGVKTANVKLEIAYDAAGTNIAGVKDNIPVVLEDGS